MSKLTWEEVWWIQFQLEINMQVTSYSYIWHKNSLFQYKLLNNVLYLNKKLFHFGIISQPKCSICNLYDETPQHLFYECIYTQHLWNQLQIYISGKIALPDLTPQSAIFGFTDVLDQNYIIINHLLLILKYNVYNSRVNNTRSFQSLNVLSLK